MELQFDKSGKISGAAIRTYLLERSRVCQTSSPERNYHCFYFLCSAPSEVNENLLLVSVCYLKSLVQAVTYATFYVESVVAGY